MAKKGKGGTFERSKHLLITWPEGHELEDLEIRMRRLGIDDMKQLAKLADESGDSTDGFTILSRRISQSVVSWNLTEEGVPVKCTPEYLDADFELTSAIMTNWMDTAASVSVPLESRSTAGSQSAEQMTELEALLGSPGN